MAVYQGARHRRAFAFALPAVLRPALTPRTPGGRRATREGAAAPALPRTHGRRNTRARVGSPRVTTQRVGLALAGIAIVFSGAFLWLSQSVRVTATNYDIIQLAQDRDRLQALSVDLQSELDRLAGAPAVRQQALDQGYGQLGAPLVVQAR